MSKGSKKMSDNWSDFEKYLIARIDQLEARLGKLEVRIYSISAILVLTLNFAAKKGWL